MQMELPKTNTSDTSIHEQQPKKDTPWKLILLCVVFVGVFVLFVFYPPAKQILYETQFYLQNQGWYGNLGLCLIASCIVVPLGIPYTMFQMMFAIMIPQYWLALLLTSTSQALGSTIAYGIMKYVFRERLALWAKNQAIFRGIDLILNRNPLKFSVILNLTNLPLIIKNYALAMPESVGFKTFTISSIIGAFFTSAPQIYLFQETQDINNLFDHSKNPLSTAFTIISTILSVGIILYFIWYTKKILTNIQKEMKALEPAEGKEVADFDVKIDIKPTRQAEEGVDKFETDRGVLTVELGQRESSTRDIPRV